MEQCPCGSGTTYESCCGQYITGRAFPSTPEKLMRSRYTAYTQANIDYIGKTMKGPAMRNFEPNEARDWAEKVEWERLQIVNASPVVDNIGFVEFLVYFHQNGKRHAMHELSEFHLVDDAWIYYDGRPPKDRAQVDAPSKKRNDPCICGSGKKFKKCCGNTL